MAGNDKKNNRGFGLELILLVVILTGLGLHKIYLYSITPTIAKDSIFLLRTAKDMSGPAAKAMRESYVHPGYPALVNITHSIFYAAQDTCQSWADSGFLVAMTFYLLGLLGVFTFAKILFAKSQYKTWIALASMVLLGLAKKMAILGSDPLSDSAASCFAVWATIAAIMTTEQIVARRNIQAILLAATAGILIGLAYLVRFETIACVAIMAAAMFIWPMYKKQGRGLMVASLIIMAVFIVLATLPYTLAIGTFSNKYTLKLYATALPVGDSMAMLAAATPYPVDETPIIKFLSKFSELLHPANSVLLVMYCLSAVLGAAVKKCRVLLDSLPRPAALPAFVAVGMFLVFAAITSFHYSRSGAMASRYLCIPAMLVIPLGAAEIIAIMVYISKYKSHAVGKTIAIIIFAAISLGMAFHATQPGHEDEIIFRQAGKYIAANMADKKVLVDENMIHFYADSPNVTSIHDIYQEFRKANPGLKGSAATREAAFASYVESPDTEYQYFAVSMTGHKIDELKLKAIKGRHCKPLKEFGAADGDTVVIYSLPK